MADTDDRSHARRSVRLTSRAPLVGRELELSEAQQALDRVISGHSGILIVRGDPGAGKTRLVDELVAQNEHQAVVVTARCSQMATGPLAPAISLLDQASQLPDARRTATSAAYGSLTGLLDRLEGRGGAPESEASGDMLARASCLALLDAVKLRPSIIVIDDAHWADAQTAAFLEQLCTEVSDARRHQPVLSVLSARSIDPDDTIGIVLERVERMGRSTAIDLRPLSEMDLRDLLIGHGVPNPDRRFVSMISEVSRGNPLFVREALRQIDARGAFRAVSGRTATRLSAQDLAPPRELGELVDRRLRGVDPEIVELLSLAAVLDDVIDPVLLAGMGAPGDRLDEWLDQAEAIDLVSWNGSALEFSHPVIRQVLYARLERRRRGVLHHNAADALRAAVPDESLEERAGEIAHHLLRSDDSSPDPDRLTILWLAGRAAFHRYAWSEASRFLDAALEMCSGLGFDDRSLGWFQYWAGRSNQHDGSIQRALKLYDAAITAGRDSGDVALWARAALWRLKQGKVEGAAALAGTLETSEIEQALQALADDSPGLRARLLDEYCQVVLQAGDTVAGERAAQDAANLADESGDDRVIARCQATVGLALLARGSMDEASEHFSVAQQRSRSCGADMTNLWSTVRLALADWLRADLTAADRSIAEALDILAVVRDLSAACVLHAISAAVASARGDFVLAATETERSTKLFELTDYSFTPLILFPTIIESYAGQGEVKRAAAAIQQWRSSGHIGSEIGALGFDARRGHAAEAHVLDQVLGLAQLASVDSLLAPSLLGAICEYAFARGEPSLLDGLEPSIDALGRGGARFGPGLGNLVGRTTALAAEVNGQSEVAARWYNSTILFSGQAGCLPEQARCHLGLARTLLASDPETADHHMAAAIRLCRQLGLVETGAQVLDLYEAAGEQPPRDRTETARDTMVLLMTDIVDSTRLSVEKGDVAYLETVDLHDRIMRRRLPPHGGREIDTTGDGMLVSFEDADDAARCAIEVQRDVADHNTKAADSDRPELTVRAGIAIGSPINRGGRLYGTAVNRAARLCATADGGEIAIDAAVRRLLDDAVPTRSVGPVDLKGFAQPASVHLISSVSGDTDGSSIER